MKKILTILALLTLAPAAAAQKTYTMSTCESVTITSLTDNYVFSWKTDAVFPNSPESYVSYRLSGDLVVKCPDLTITTTTSTLKMQFKDTDTMLKYLFPRDDNHFNLLYVSWYDYPSIQAGFNSTYVSFNRLFEVTEDLRPRPVGMTVGYKFSDSVVGYKVNGAPLKPLIFSGKVQPLQATLKDRVEFYSKLDSKSSIIKNVFDFKTATYTYEKVSEFPK